MTTVDVIHFLEEDGWKEIKSTNKEYKYLKHPTKLGKICLPIIKDEISIKTLNAIFKKARLI